MSDTPCAQCQTPIPAGEPSMTVDAGTLCMPCYDALRAEVQRQVQALTSNINYPLAFAGNAAGAAVGAGIYAASVALSGWDIALVAIAIPWLGVRAQALVIGPKRSQALQVMTIALSLGFFAISRVLTAWMVFNDMAAEQGMETIPLAMLPLASIDLLFAIAQPLDLLWVGIVAYEAWRLSKPYQIR